MNQSVIHTLNNPELLKARQVHLDRLERLFAGEELESPFILSGYCGNGRSDPAKDPEKWVEESLTDLYEHAELKRAGSKSAGTDRGRQEVRDQSVRA